MDGWMDRIQTTRLLAGQIMEGHTRPLARRVHVGPMRVAQRPQPPVISQPASSPSSRRAALANVSSEGAASNTTDA
jgi:hypothetical protein